MNRGEKILHETREEGLQAILPFQGNIQEACFETVRAHRAGLTAEEVQEAVGCSLNSARSRLTELFKAARLVVVGKRANKLGTRQIAVYTVPKERS